MRTIMQFMLHLLVLVEGLYLVFGMLITSLFFIFFRVKFWTQQNPSFRFITQKKVSYLYTKRIYNTIICDTKKLLNKKSKWTSYCFLNTCAPSWCLMDFFILIKKHQRTSNVETYYINNKITISHRVFQTDLFRQICS